MSDGPGGTPRPATRAERQEQTRQALVHAAREVFARDGFHGARLERIATEAGYSKGAVYSNFDGKADLFLAVMDANLAAVGDEPWDPFDHVATPPEAGTPDAEDAARLAEAMGGFALATLEFIASAARDDVLRAALAERVCAVLTLYSGVAAAGRAPDDPLPAERLGALLAALDQGMALLTLSGAVEGDATLVRTGLRRLVAAGHLPADTDGTDDTAGTAGTAGTADTADTADAADTDGTADTAGTGGAPGAGGLHDEEIRRRIADSIRER